MPITPEERGRARADAKKDAAEGTHRGPRDNSSLYSNVAESSEKREDRKKVYNETFREEREFLKKSK